MRCMVSSAARHRLIPSAYHIYQGRTAATEISSALWRPDRRLQPDPHLQEVQPDEVYNPGAMSHVAVSFESPEYTADVDAMGTLRLLEAIRFLGLERKRGSTGPL